MPSLTPDNADLRQGLASQSPTPDSLSREASRAVEDLRYREALRDYGRAVEEINNRNYQQYEYESKNERARVQEVEVKQEPFRPKGFPPSEPSTGSPPPSARTGGGSTPPSYESMPRTAAPRQPVVIVDLPPTTTPRGLPATPSSLPTMAGGTIVAGGGVVFAADFLTRVAHGQDPRAAGYAAGGAAAGSIVGGGVGSLFGPVGTAVGGLVGGWVGGEIAGRIWDAANPRTAEIPIPQGSVLKPKNRGKAGIQYELTVEGYFTNSPSNPPRRVVGTTTITGPLLGLTIELSEDGREIGISAIHGGENLATAQKTPGFAVWTGALKNVGMSILSMIPLNRRYYPPESSPPPYVPNEITVTPGTMFHPNQFPGGIDWRTGSGRAGGNADNGWISGGTLGGAPAGDSNLGGDLPGNYPAPTPPPTMWPDAVLPGPANRGGLSAPMGTAPAGIGSPGGSPGSSPGSSPSGIAGAAPSAPFGSPSAAARPAPIPYPRQPNPDEKLEPGKQPNPTPEPPKSDQDLALEKIKQQLDGLEKLLAPMFANPKNPFGQLPTHLSDPNEFRDKVSEGVCKTTNPGGCMSNAINKPFDSKDSTSFSANLNTRLGAIQGTTAANSSMLVTVLTRLGEQIPGGLSAFALKTWAALKNTWNFLQIDRVLNILTYVTVLHNAFMLSNSVAQTLFSGIGNVMAVFGIGEMQEDGTTQPYNIGEVVGKWTSSFFSSLFGADNYENMKATWRKYSRIYQAAANLMLSIQSIGYSILSALEVIGNWIANIGNALRKWGEVGERAYRWMNPEVNFQNRWFTGLEKATEVVSQVDQVASEVLSAQQTVAQLGSLKEELNNSIKDAGGGMAVPEAEKVMEAFEAGKSASLTTIPPEAEQRPEPDDDAANP